MGQRQARAGYEVNSKQLRSERDWLMCWWHFCGGGYGGGLWVRQGGKSGASTRISSLRSKFPTQGRDHCSLLSPSLFLGQEWGFHDHEHLKKSYIPFFFVCFVVPFSPTHPPKTGFLCSFGGCARIKGVLYHCLAAIAHLVPQDDKGNPQVPWSKGFQ